MSLSSKSTIAKNTMLLYVRTLFVLFISLWTSRVILESLGVEDFGIYNAVGGLVGMFSVLTGSMSTAISRYITFEIGKGNLEKLKKTFSTSVIIQLLFIAVIVLVAETVGLWFLNSKMVIPDERIVAANWVFQFTVITFCFSLLAVPYNSELIAHEHMNIYAFVSVVDTVCKLVIAFLIFVSPIDKLIFYSGLMALLSILVRAFYQIYCKNKFQECRQVIWKIDKESLLDMGKFAGWNMFGQAAYTCRSQGISILLNLFFGPLLNAAYGVANQVNNAVMSFTNNFTTAFAPSITKAYAEEKYSYMNGLILQGARYSYFLLLLFVLPITLETDMALSLWLKNVPDFAVPFVRLTLIYSLIEILSMTMIKGVAATGNIKKYQIIVGTCSLATIPVAYLFLKFGADAISTMWVSISIAIIALFARLIIVRSQLKIGVWTFLSEVIFKVLLVTIISSIFPIILHFVLQDSLLSSAVVVCISLLCSCLAIMYVGCSKHERASIINSGKNFLRISK